MSNVGPGLANCTCSIGRNGMLYVWIDLVSCSLAFYTSWTVQRIEVVRLCAVQSGGQRALGDIRVHRSVSYPLNTCWGGGWLAHLQK